MIYKKFPIRPLWRPQSRFKDIKRKFDTEHHVENYEERFKREQMRRSIKKFLKSDNNFTWIQTQPIRKLSGSTHFHYDSVELGPIRIQIDRTDPEISRRLHSINSGSGDPSSSSILSSSQLHDRDHAFDNKDDQAFTIFLYSNDKSWSFRRNLRDFVGFDRQLHRCVYDRRFSKLPELFSMDGKENYHENIETVTNQLGAYFKRFSDLAGSLITCFPVLKWLELDSRGNHLFAAEETPINTPAIASAYVVRNYTAQNCNEICLNIGDIVSIIDMPDPSESFWWRGKLTIGRRYRTSSVEDGSLSVSCQVGFFPSECVQVFGNRIETLPVALRGSEYDKPVFQRRKNFVSLFKNFLLTRPPRRRLKESGLLMERVFGCDLAEHLINTGRDVPEVLKFCCAFIEQRGVVDGIYRLSGAASNIQRLRCIFDEKKLPESNDLFIIRDVHSVASLLKTYFRELPNPLFTHHLYDLLVAAVSNQDHTMKILRLHDVIQQLPPPYFRTAEHLMKHLARVGEHWNKTGMTFQNLAIIWAPNLLRSHKFDDIGDDAAFLLQNVNIQAVIVEYLIRYADMIFSRKMPLLSSFAADNWDEVCSTLPRRSAYKHKCDSRQRDILHNAISVPIGTKFSSTLGLPDLSNRKCIDVNGGPAALPPKYHTVLEIPSSRRQLYMSKASSHVDASPEIRDDTSNSEAGVCNAIDGNSHDCQAKVLYRSNTSVGARTSRKSRVNCKAFSEDFNCHRVPYTISVRINLEPMKPVTDAVARCDVPSPLAVESQRASFSLSNDEGAKRLSSLVAAVSSDFDLPTVFSSDSSSVNSVTSSPKILEQQAVFNNRDDKNFLQNNKKVAKVLPLNEKNRHHFIIGDITYENEVVQDIERPSATVKSSDRHSPHQDFWKPGSRITTYSLDSEIDAVCRQFLQNSSKNKFVSEDNKQTIQTVVDSAVASSSYNNEFLSHGSKNITVAADTCPNCDRLDDLLDTVSEDLNALEKYSFRNRRDFGSLSFKSNKGHDKDADENFDHPRRLIKRLSLVETSSNRTSSNFDERRQFTQDECKALVFDKVRNRLPPPSLSHRPTTKPVSLDEEMPPSCSSTFSNVSKREADHETKTTPASFYENNEARKADAMPAIDRRLTSSVGTAVGKVASKLNKIMNEQSLIPEPSSNKIKNVAKVSEAIDSGDELIHCPLFRKQRQALAASLYFKGDIKSSGVPILESATKEQPRSNFVYFV